MQRGIADQPTTLHFNIIASLERYCRPTNNPADQEKNGKMEVGIADDQAKDFDFAKTEMKYDSTGMFHWTPARSIEDCILVRKGWDREC